MQGSLKSHKKGTLHAHQYTLLNTPRSVLLRIRNISDKIVQKIRTQILCSTNFFFENRAAYEMWKSTAESDRPQTAIWCMRTACWGAKATNNHSEYVILNDFQLQQWLKERASVLRHSTLPVLFYMFFLRK